MLNLFSSRSSIKINHHDEDSSTAFDQSLRSPENLALSEAWNMYQRSSKSDDAFIVFANVIIELFDSNDKVHESYKQGGHPKLILEKCAILFLNLFQIEIYESSNRLEAYQYLNSKLEMHKDNFRVIIKGIDNDSKSTSSHELNQSYILKVIHVLAILNRSSNNREYFCASFGYAFYLITLNAISAFKLHLEEEIVIWSDISLNEFTIIDKSIQSKLIFTLSGLLGLIQLCHFDAENIDKSKMKIFHQHAQSFAYSHWQIHQVKLIGIDVLLESYISPNDDVKVSNETMVEVSIHESLHSLSSAFHVTRLDSTNSIAKSIGSSSPKNNQMLNKLSLTHLHTQAIHIMIAVLQKLFHLSRAVENIFDTANDCNFINKESETLIHSMRRFVRIVQNELLFSIYGVLSKTRYDVSNPANNTILKEYRTVDGPSTIRSYLSLPLTSFSKSNFMAYYGVDIELIVDRVFLCIYCHEVHLSINNTVNLNFQKSQSHVDGMEAFNEYKLTIESAKPILKWLTELLLIEFQQLDEKTLFSQVSIELTCVCQLKCPLPDKDNILTIPSQNMQNNIKSDESYQKVSDILRIVTQASLNSKTMPDFNCFSLSNLSNKYWNSRWQSFRKNNGFKSINELMDPTKSFCFAFLNLFQNSHAFEDILMRAVEKIQLTPKSYEVNTRLDSSNGKSTEKFDTHAKDLQNLNKPTGLRSLFQRSKSSPMKNDSISSNSTYPSTSTACFIPILKLVTSSAIDRILSALFQIATNFHDQSNHPSIAKQELFRVSINMAMSCVEELLHNHNGIPSESQPPVSCIPLHISLFQTFLLINLLKLFQATPVTILGVLKSEGLWKRFLCLSNITTINAVNNPEYIYSPKNFLKKTVFFRNALRPFVRREISMTLSTNSSPQGAPKSGSRAATVINQIEDSLDSNFYHATWSRINFDKNRTRQENSKILDADFAKDVANEQNVNVQIIRARDTMPAMEMETGTLTNDPMINSLYTNKLKQSPPFANMERNSKEFDLSKRTFSVEDGVKAVEDGVISLVNSLDRSAHLSADSIEPNMLTKSSLGLLDPSKIRANSSFSDEANSSIGNLDNKCSDDEQVNNYDHKPIKQFGRETSKSNRNSSVSDTKQNKNSSMNEERFSDIFLNAILKDIILEFMWIAQICWDMLENETVGNIEDQNSIEDSQLSRNSNELASVASYLNCATSDESLIQLTRWLRGWLDYRGTYHVPRAADESKNDLTIIWKQILIDCLKLTRLHLDVINSSAPSPNQNFLLPQRQDYISINKRPLFWPARSGVIQLIAAILYGTITTKWIEVFIPSSLSESNKVKKASKNRMKEKNSLSTVNPSVKSNAPDKPVSDRRNTTNEIYSTINYNLRDETNMVESSYITPTKGPNPESVLYQKSPSNGFVSLPTTPGEKYLNTNRSSRLLKDAPSKLKSGIHHNLHSSILSLILDPLSRDFAVVIILKIIHECCSRIFETRSELGNSSSIDSKTLQLQQLQILNANPVYEALSHDVIKGVLNSIRNSAQQPDFSNASNSILACICALNLLIREPQIFSTEKHASIAQCQRVFAKYGIQTPHLNYYGWTHSRPNIFRDILLSLDSTFKYSNHLWQPAIRTLVINHALGLLTALMIGNDAHKEIFRQVMMQKSKRKSLNLLSRLSNDTKPFQYHELVNLILSGCEIGGNVSFDTIVIIFEMLLDGFSHDNFYEQMQLYITGVKDIPSEGLFCNQRDVPMIVNMNAIPILLNLICYCSESVQFFIINTMNNLIGVSKSSSQINLSKCSQMEPPILEVLLDVFSTLNQTAQSSAVKLMQSIGRHAITVAQLKRMFRLIHLTDGRSKDPKYVSSLMDALEGMVLEQVIPKHFFFFRGKDSGLRIPAFKKWPAPNGYSFSIWFRVDQPHSGLFHPNSNKHNIYEQNTTSTASRNKQRSSSSHELFYIPRLFSFRQEVSGIGVEVYLTPTDQSKSKYIVTISTFSGPKTSPATVDGGIIKLSRNEGLQWHHLVFSHTASTFRSKSEIAILVDGQELVRKALSYPKFNDEVKFPTIGDVGPSFKDDATHSTYYGQVAAIYFFSEPISEFYLRNIFKLGPSYSQTFSDRDILQSSTRAVDKILDGSLTNMIMLAYNPGVWKGNLFIDNSPAENNASRWKSVGFTEKLNEFELTAEDIAGILGAGSKSMNALKLKGTHVCTTRDMRDSLDCLGGIKVLLPLFCLLDTPTTSIATIPTSGSTIELIKSFKPAEEITEDSKGLYNKILHLFFTLLRETPENAKFMSDNSFSLISYFMELLTPEYLTLDVLNTLIHQSQRLSIHINWQNEMYRQLFCNFKLWAFTSFEVQRKLMDHLLSFVTTHFERVMEGIIPIQLLFDALLNFYSNDAFLVEALKQNLRFVPVQKKKLDTSLNLAGIANTNNAVVRRGSHSNFRSGISKHSNHGGKNSQKLENKMDINKMTGKKLLKELGWYTHYYQLNQEQVHEMRDSIFQIFYIVLSNTTNKNISYEIAVIINYIVNDSVGAEYKVDGIRLLLRLISSDKRELGMKMLKAFSFNQGLNILLPLFNHEKAKVRLYTLICFASIFHISLSYGKLPTIHYFSENNSNTSTYPQDSMIDSNKSISGHNKKQGHTNQDKALSLEEGSFDLKKMNSTKLFNDVGKKYKSFGFEKPPDPFVEDSASKANPNQDIFESLGIPVNHMAELFLWIQKQLKLNANKPHDDFEFVDQENKIIFVALQLMMHGLPCKYLVNEIEKLKPSIDSSESDQRTQSIEKNESKRSDTNEYELEVDSSDIVNTRICMPMLIPSLLEFLKFEQNLHVVKGRVKCMLSLRTSIQGLENFDVILCIPNWQSYFIELLSNEQKRINLLESMLADFKNDTSESSNNQTHGGLSKGVLEKEISNSSNVFDIIVSILSDIHMHAMCYGVPSITLKVIVTRPGELNDKKFHKMHVKELIELYKKDGRKIGGSVLGETVSWLRAYAAFGSLNVPLTGLQILQSTVNSLQRENDSLTGATESAEVLIARKIFELNLWITATYILEFITIPPIQPINLHRSQSDSVGSVGDESPCAYGKITNDFITPEKALELNKNLRKSPEIVNEISATFRNYFDDGNENERLSIEEYRNEKSPTVMIRGMNRRLTDPNINFQMETATPFTSPIETTHTNPLVNSGNKKSKGRRPGTSLSLSSVKYDDAVWHLIDSLLNLLGPKESWVIFDRMDRLKAGMVVGFWKGRNFRAQLSESTEALLNSNPTISGTTSSTTHKSVNISNSKTETVLTRAIDSVICIILRVLLNIYLQCGTDYEFTSIDAGPMKAFQQLITFLEWIKDQNREYYDLEMMYVIAKITDALRFTTQSISSPWFQATLRFLSTALISQRANLISKLETFTKFSSSVVIHSTTSVLDERESGRYTDESSLHSISSLSSTAAFANNKRPDLLDALLSSQQNDDTALISSKNIVSESAALEQDFRDFITAKIESFLQLNGETGKSASDIALDTILLSLKLPTNGKISWKVWSNGVEPLIVEARKIEDSAIANKLTDMGLHKHSEEITKLIELQKTQLDLFESSINFKVNDKYSNMMTSSLQLERLQNDRELQERYSAKKKWSDILDKLQNERGPWANGIHGADIDVNTEILWVVDLCEDNNRAKPKLSRNIYGRKFLSNFLKENASHNSEESNAPVVRKLESNQDQHNKSELIVKQGIESSQVLFQTEQFPEFEGSTNKNVWSPVRLNSNNVAIGEELEGSLSRRSNMNGIEGETGLHPDFLMDILKYTGKAAELEMLSTKKSKTIRLDEKESSFKIDTYSNASDDDEYRSDGYLSEDEFEEPKEREISTDAAVMNKEEMYGELRMSDTSNEMQLTKADLNSQILFTCHCEVILPSTNSTSSPSLGVLELTQTTLRFTRLSGEVVEALMIEKNLISSRSRRTEPSVCNKLWACQPFPSTEWSNKTIWNILPRYYQLQFIAIEIFTTSRRSYLFNMFDFKIARKFEMTLRNAVKPPYLIPIQARKPSKVIAKYLSPSGSGAHVTTAWADREITNFEYLMILNTIAGRTYNDLGQYPVFPWIISDYSSKNLDLSKTDSFRDLKWPIGAQNEFQRSLVRSKYYDLEGVYDSMSEEGEDYGGALPPFHFGTHYSVAGFVLWFLMRLEPYTSLHVQLQDGRIDRPDRLFDSLEAAYRGCTTNPADVKELIPEMFYCPELFKNINSVDFGITQNRKQIGDVVLPPWASDEFDFIKKHRDALESEYVSLNLHHWIDLIFGYKQRPVKLGGDEASVEFCNVFFHLTYENAVNLQGLKEKNKNLYQQYLCQISEFGQTPAQLFNKPHVARKPIHELDIIWSIASIVRGVETIPYGEPIPEMPKKIVCFKEFYVSIWPILFIGEANDRLITVDSTRILGYHAWQVQSPDMMPPFKLKIDTAAYELSTGQSNLSSLMRLTTYSYNSASSQRERRVGVPFAPSQALPISAARRNSLLDNAPSSRWHPIRIKQYEKDEREKTKRNLQLQFLQQTQRPGTQYTKASEKIPNISSTVDLFVKDRENIYSSPGESRANSNDKEKEMETEKSRDNGDWNYPSKKVIPSSFQTNLPAPLSISTLPPIALLRSQSIESQHTDDELQPQSRSRTATESSTSDSELIIDPSPSTKDQESKLGGQLTVPSTNNRLILQNNSNNSSSLPSKYPSSVTDENLSPHLFAFLPEMKLLFSCGHWDHSFRATATDSGKLIQSVSQHSDVVTCIALAKDFGSCWLITGSKDCTLMVWELQTNDTPFSSQPLHVLFGHDDAVSCVAVNPEMDIIVSGSDDGTMIFHNLRDGKFIRSIINKNSLTWIPPTQPLTNSQDLYDKPGNVSNVQTRALILEGTSSIPINSDVNASLPGSTVGNITRHKINWIGISKVPYIITYCADEQLLCTYSVNGSLISSKTIIESLYALILSEDGKVLITGGNSCLVVFRWCHSLEFANDGPRRGLEHILDGSMEESSIPAFASPIRSLYLTKMERHLVVGLESGELRLLAQDSDYLRVRLQKKLIEIGIL